MNILGGIRIPGRSRRESEAENPSGEKEPPPLEVLLDEADEAQDERPEAVNSNPVPAPHLVEDLASLQSS